MFAATTATKKVTQPSTTASATTATFNKDLKLGDKGSEVTKLQQYLSDNGYLTATPNGYFGKATKAGVIKLQKAKGITPASGKFGPLTRKAVNQ